MEYPLEQLVIIKHRKLEEAEKVLKEKKALLEKEHEKLVQVEKERDKVKGHYKDKLKQLRETLDAGTTSDKVQQMKHYLKLVDEQLKQKEHKVKEQLTKVEQAEKQVEAARADFLKKQRDVEKLRIHRKEWEKEVRIEEERKEASEEDEMGSAMFSNRKRKNKKR